MGDYFELLGALVNAGIDVKTVGQSDLTRVGLVPKFTSAGLDPKTLVLNGGAGIEQFQEPARVHRRQGKIKRGTAFDRHRYLHRSLNSVGK
jgi:hypothetical protein